MQHGIESVAIRASQPCIDSLEYGASEKQMFYRLDFRYEHRVCATQDTVYKQITLKPQQQINEFDFEYENSLLKKLEEMLNLTYSMWPSQEFKIDIDMKFY